VPFIPNMSTKRPGGTQAHKLPKLAPSSDTDLYLKRNSIGATVLRPGTLSAPKPKTDRAEGGRVKAKTSKEPETAGIGWADMRAPTLTTELKRDLQIVKMRGAFDPKRFYRSSDMKKGLPKFFQVGTLIEGSAEGSSSRLTRKERKQSMLEELLADSSLRARAKKRTKAVIAASSAGRKKMRLTPGTRKKSRRS